MQIAPDAPGRPILRYHGGKYRLAPWVISFFPEHRIYCEPFGGGASVLLQKPRTYAEIYNDLDSEVVNVFRVLRCPALAKDLANLLYLTPFAREEFVECYQPLELGQDAYGEQVVDPVEMARRTIIKSFMGFGSNAIMSKNPKGMRTASSQWRSPSTGFRADTHRSGTTPAYDWTHWPAHIPAFVERLRGVVIENRDALEVMTQHDREDCLHYVDPPYVFSTRNTPGGSYRHEMTDDDHRKLAAFLLELEGMVVLSGYPSALYDELYGGWQRFEKAHRADKAAKRVEVIWVNPAALSRLNGRLDLD